jgi:chemotaxis protein histidine kinase CheA
MSDAPAASFAERFAAIRREWEGMLPGRLQEVRALAAALREAPHDAERLDALYRLLHTLAGSGATFGRPALGDAARAAEHALDAARHAGRGGDDAALQAGVQALLGAQDGIGG